MNELLQKLAQLGPALGAGIAGNGDGMAAFMDGYQRTMAQMEAQKNRSGEMDLRREELEMRRGDRDQVLARQAEQDKIAAADRTRRQGMESLQVPGMLSEMGGTAENPEDAQRLIESLMPKMMEIFGQDAMAYGQPAVEMATRTITGRQKKQVGDFVEAAIKTAFVADNPDSDPEIANLPEHIAKVVGKPSAKLSELQSFAQMPVGKPAAKKETPAPFNLSPGQTRYDGQGQPIASLPDRPRAATGSDPEVAELRKELLRLQVQNAGTPKEPNQNQFTSAGYAARIEQAEPILTKVAPSIVGMSLPSFTMQTDSWFAKPTFQSDDVQSYMQAARNFINSVLRRESGAVISPSEFAEARQQYLPVSGDTPEALAQKAANRATVAANMKRSAGAAYEPPAGVGGGAVTVKAPDGSTHEFATQAQADAFKKLAGIK